jgi:hypothetical protein
LFHFEDDRYGIIRNVNLKDVSYIDGDTVLTIAYESFAPNNQRLEKVDLSINMSDFGIIEFTRVGLWNIETVTTKFKKEPNGRYYPYFIRRISPAIFDKGGRRRYTYIETFETELVEQPGKSLKAKNLEDRAKDFDKSKFDYDSAFWQDYERQLPSSLHEEVLKSLERERPLGDQFADHKRGNR